MMTALLYQFIKERTVLNMKYGLWAAANLIDTKVVNSIEEGKKWAKKKWLTD